MSTTLRAFFAGRVKARRLFTEVVRAVERAGPSTMRVTRSQIAFRRRRAFAWVWTPDRWLHAKTAPLVLSIALPRPDASRRWKEILEVGHGRWMHHLELRTLREIDEEVRGWLTEAWQDAGGSPTRV